MKGKYLMRKVIEEVDVAAKRLGRKIRFIARYGPFKFREIQQVGANPYFPDAMDIWDVGKGVKATIHHTHLRDCTTTANMCGPPFFGELDSWWVPSDDYGKRGERSIADMGIVPYGVGNGNRWNESNYATVHTKENPND